MRNIPPTYAARLMCALARDLSEGLPRQLSDDDLAEMMPDDAPRTRREALLVVSRSGAITIEGRGRTRRVTINQHPWWSIARHVVAGLS